jgi:sugar phosphate isomerase/epimerase
MSMERRAFLGLGLASVAGLPASAALGQAASRQGRRGGCGIAIGTYGLQSMPLVEAIRLVAETGYNAVEIAAMKGTTGSPTVLASEDRARLRDLIGESGLRLCGLMVDLQPKRLLAEHREQLAEVYHFIKLARDLSPEATPVVQTVLGGKDWEASRALFRDRIADWVQVAADLKGFLSIKPHRFHAMTTPAEAVWLIEQLGAPSRLGLTFDYSHYAFLDPALGIPEAVASARRHVNYVASKDAVLEGGSVRFALVGEGGAWDHAEIVAALHDEGYRGDFCAEVSSQIWKGDPAYDAVAATKLCHANLAAAFERAGVARR